jgi:hypothetical protein
MRDLAYAMMVLATAASAACITLFTMTFKRRRLALGPNFHARWCRAALITAAVAAIVATLSFCAGYATAGDGTATGADIHMHVMGVLQLAVSLGVLVLTVIPILDLRQTPQLRSFIAALSSVFWIFSGWLLLLIQGLPGNAKLAYFGYGLLLALTMGQVFYPHGWYRKRDEERYLTSLDNWMHLGSYSLIVATILSGPMTIVDIVATSAWSPIFYSLTCLAVFAIAGLGFFSASVSTEGWRKHQRIPGAHRLAEESVAGTSRPAEPLEPS